VGAESMAAFGTSGGWTGFLGIIVAVVQFIVGFGLWNMKKWAWILALIGAILTVVEGVVGMLNGGPFAFMCGSLGVVIPVIILIYLLLNTTRQAFGVGTTGT
jgi:uncharacterized membrane protein (DUF2068 family)